MAARSIQTFWQPIIIINLTSILLSHENSSRRNILFPSNCSVNLNDILACVLLWNIETFLLLLRRQLIYYICINHNFYLNTIVLSYIYGFCKKRYVLEVTSFEGFIVHEFCCIRSDLEACLSIICRMYYHLSCQKC